MDITSRKNPKVMHLKKLGTSKEYREESGEFLCDGEKLLREAIMSGAEIREVLYSDTLPLKLPEGVSAFHVPYEIIRSASPLSAAQNVLFSVAMPPKRDETIPAGAIILENMQDPGNVGTVIRTAKALGISAVVLVGSCADIYNPKCIRSTMGAVFTEYVFEADIAAVTLLKQQGTRVLGAALDKKSTTIQEPDLKNAVVAL